VLDDSIVVSDDDDGPSVLRGKAAEQGHHGLAVLPIERRGRFVGQNDPWVARQGARDRDPLLLSAAEVGGKCVALFRKTDGVEELGGGPAKLAARNALEVESYGDVLPSAEGGKEIVSLKDETDVAAAES